MLLQIGTFYPLKWLKETNKQKKKHYHHYLSFICSWFTRRFIPVWVQPLVIKGFEDSFHLNHMASVNRSDYVRSREYRLRHKAWRLVCNLWAKTGCVGKISIPHLVGSIAEGWWQLLKAKSHRSTNVSVTSDLWEPSVTVGWEVGVDFFFLHYCLAKCWHVLADKCEKLQTTSHFFLVFGATSSLQAISSSHSQKPPTATAKQSLVIMSNVDANSWVRCP